MNDNNTRGLRLFLVEFAVAILIFAIASVFCLGAFVSAINTMNKTRQLDAAVLASENIAETLKAKQEPPAEITLKLDEKLQETTEKPFLEVKITPAPAPENLAIAKITVTTPKQNDPIHEITVAWQLPDKS